MSKEQKHVVFPIDEKRWGIMDAQAKVEKFTHRWGLKLVNIKEPAMTNIYWNAGMNAYLKRPRGYLNTHAVYVAVANTPTAAKKAAAEWVRWLNQDYEMKPESAALANMIRPRNEFLEDRSENS